MSAQYKLEPLIAFLGSPIELLIVGAVVLLLFGNRLPSVARSLGQSFIEFKKGVQGIEDDKEQEADAPRKKKRVTEVEEDEESDITQKVK